MKRLRFQRKALLCKPSGTGRQVFPCHRPFCLDRLQGAWWFLQYDFDRPLLREYQDISGGWMPGLQMHEWASNMRNDWERIREGLKDPPSKQPSAEEIREATCRNTHAFGVNAGRLKARVPKSMPL